MNMIQDTKILLKDIEIAERIFGNNIGAIKGLTTRKIASNMIDPSIMLPEELYKIKKDVTLAIDIIKVNNCYFLTSISLHIFYRTAQYLNRLTAVNLAKALEEVIQTYKKENLTITIIKADNKFQRIVKVIQELLPQDNIKFDFCAPNDHIPEAERNN